MAKRTELDICLENSSLLRLLLASFTRIVILLEYWSACQHTWLEIRATFLTMSIKFIDHSITALAYTWQLFAIWILWWEVLEKIVTANAAYLSRSASVKSFKPSSLTKALEQSLKCLA